MKDLSSPYGDSAALYHALGWSPVPLPHGKKLPPPKGYTGKDAPMASADEVESWAAESPESNVGLRVPCGVIGIDVDAHKGDAERNAFEELERRLGPLPDAPRCSSREDGISGIRLYRVPDDFVAADLGLAGEVVQHHHRYVVAPPSVHPETGREYVWANGEPPAVSELPWLPQTWRDGLDASAAKDSKASSDPGSGWTDPDLSKLVADGIPVGQGQDDTLRDVVWKLRADGISKNVAHGIWQAVVQKSALTKPGQPWTTEDFERHWKGADRKISRETGSQSDPASLSLTALSDIPMRKVRWAWDTTAGADYPGSGGRFPIGTLCIGAGRPGAGKGQFAAWLGAKVSTGQLPGCFAGTPKGVIIYTTEDSHTMTVGPRFKAAGADLSRVFVFSRPETHIGGFAVVKLQNELAQLERLIRENDIGLVIFDPLISVLSASTDVNSEVAVRSELEPFQAMLDNLDCFAFGIMHYRKMKDEDILNMFSGSGAFPRLVRAAVAFGTDKDDDGNATHVLSTVKNNLGRIDLPSYSYRFVEMPLMIEGESTYVSRLEFTGESAWSVEEINEGRNSADKARTALDEACTWLELQVASGPKMVEDIKAELSKDAAAYSWSTIERAKRKLKLITRKDGFGGKSTWALPQRDEIDEIDEIDEYGTPFSSSNPHSRQSHQKMYAREAGEYGEKSRPHTRQQPPFSSASPAAEEAIRQYPLLATV